MERHYLQRVKEQQVLGKPPFGWEKDIYMIAENNRIRYSERHQTIEVPNEQAIIAYVKMLVENKPDITCYGIAKALNVAIDNKTLIHDKHMSPNQITRIVKFNNIPLMKKRCKPAILNISQ